MNNRIKFSIAFSILLLASLACSLTGLLPGGETGLRTTGELWSDVPKMDGLGASDMELPLVARIFMETMVSGILSGGTGNGDVAVFNTTQSVADIQAYYTNERMTAAGWAASEQDTCFSGTDQGVEDVGLMCIFYKESDSNQTGLVVLATPGEQAGQTALFFIRIENAATQTP